MLYLEADAAGAPLRRGTHALNHLKVSDLDDFLREQDPVTKSNPFINYAYRTPDFLPELTRDMVNFPVDILDHIKYFLADWYFSLLLLVFFKVSLQKDRLTYIVFAF